MELQAWAFTFEFLVLKLETNRRKFSTWTQEYDDYGWHCTCAALLGDDSNSDVREQIREHLRLKLAINDISMAHRIAVKSKTHVDKQFAINQV